MSEMIERVAQAICGAFNFPATVAWEETKPDVAEKYRLIARAAIEAMRDYSEPMSQAGGAVTQFEHDGRAGIGQSAAERCYLAMIDAALAEHAKQDAP